MTVEPAQTMASAGQAPHSEKGVNTVVALHTHPSAFSTSSEDSHVALPFKHVAPTGHATHESGADTVDMKVLRAQVPAAQVNCAVAVPSQMVLTLHCAHV